MTTDEYLQSQVMPLLQPGEQVLGSAYMRRQPGLLMQMLFVGGLLLFLITKAYFVVITNRRMILIQTKMGFWTGGPKLLNLGVEQHDVRAFRECTTSGFANNRSMTWHMHQGGSMTLRISPWNKKVSGTAQFLEQVPQMINSGHLAQLAAGAPQMQQLQPGPPQQQQAPQGYPQQQQQPQQAPQAQMQQQPQQAYQQPQPPPQQQHQQGFPAGARVLVVAQDGNRYPATVAQAAQGQYLCTMPDGQSYWFPMQSVGPA
ncbi:MAG: hypothetical protein ABI867_04660 [Kofleriaceae bacterium]